MIEPRKPKRLTPRKPASAHEPDHLTVDMSGLGSMTPEMLETYSAQVQEQIRQSAFPQQLPGDKMRRLVPAMVCFTGDRHAVDSAAIRKRIKDFLIQVKMHHNPVLVIHGACRGVDTIAADVARMMRMPVTAYPYKDGFGKAGGPMRNAEMVNALLRHQAKPGYSIVAMLHDDFVNSTGTKDMIEQAQAAGLPTVSL
jgi:hypothetical protein